MKFPKTIEQKIIAFSKSNRPIDMVPYLVGEIKSGCVSVKTLLEHARKEKNEETNDVVITADILCKLGDAFLKEKNEEIKKQSSDFYQLAADKWNIAENFERAKSESYGDNQNILLALTCANKVIALNGNRHNGYLTVAYKIKVYCHEKLGEWTQVRRARFLETFTLGGHEASAVNLRAQFLRSEIVDERTPVSASKPIPKSINTFFNRRPKKCSNETEWFNSVNPEEHIHFSIEKENISRRHAAETRFFDPSRSSKIKKLKVLVLKIIDARFEQSDDSVPIGDNARQMISAENMFQRAARALADDNDLKLGMPVSKKRLRESGTKIYGPIERYHAGETTIELEHRADLSRNRFNLYVLNLGTYETLYRTLILKLTNDDAEKEKQLAFFMIRYGKTHQGVSLEELQAMNASATIDDVNKFKRLCFLMLDKEQGQWLSAPDKKYHLGLSVSQARCLILLKEGVIRFKNVFSSNPSLGVYSCPSLLSDAGRDALLAACQRIDDLYLTYLQKSKYCGDYAAFLNKYENQPGRKCILRTAHQDLKTVYGGDSDTDGEGYNSDMSLSM